jgi:Tfp pilus assembly protein PilE
VLLIIGVLLAIAIPTFLSVTKGANGTAAQANLTSSLTGAKAYYTDSNQSYTGLISGNGVGGKTSTLSQIDTGLDYVSGAFAPGGKTIDLQTAPNGTWLEMAAWAPGQQDCWLIFDNAATANIGTPNLFPVTGTGASYGVIRHLASNASCTTGVAPVAWSTNGFPSP